MGSKTSQNLRFQTKSRRITVIARSESDEAISEIASLRSQWRFILDSDLTFQPDRL